METRIETTTASNKDIDFPALSVCHEMPHSHDSWELPTMIFNALDWINCGTGCKKNLVKQKLSAFKNFFGTLIDKHLASEDPTNSYTSDENGEQKPLIGGFMLPYGYKGIQFQLTFRTVYCKLGKKLQEGAYMWKLENLMKRWKSSFYTMKILNLDILMEEYQVYIDFESFGFWDLFDTCDDVNDDVMRFLSKLYLITFDSNIILENFGSSLRHLVDYGSLEIMPWSGAPVKTSDDGWVS